MACRSIVPPTEASLAETLAHRARHSPDRRVFAFLADGITESATLSFGELHRRALEVATWLGESAAPGDRVLLVFQPGLDFITALCGCFFSGTIPVPCSPPRIDARGAGGQPLEGIARDCRPRLALFGPGMGRLRTACADLPGLEGVACTLVDDIPTGTPVAAPTLPQRDDLALIQYTSGSTGDPKGVMLSHGNLLANEFVIQQAFGHGPGAAGSGVSWLPFHHDMGLIGNILHVIYVDACCYLLSPLTILQRPLRWLEAIDRHDAHTSGGPNFAYDLCVERITAAQKATLDLSRWDVAYIGAERVSAETIERFAEAFAPCGFRREAFFPCYGLAEGTLMVTGGDELAGPVVRPEAPGPADDPNRRRFLVGCGRGRPGHEVLVVDPDTRVVMPDAAVGEIWCRGPSVARGYWNRPTESDATFRARLAAGGHEEFLRTGDLGFLVDGELFVTGRLKDVIIIRGTNHDPQAIEETAAGLHEAFRRHGTAAFGCLVDDEERLVVLQEIERHARNIDPEALATELRDRIAFRHGVQAHDILWLRHDSLPRTTSGKIRRHECRRRYLDGTLVLWQPEAPPA
jgi:acyl-CoA synthetase (AMP-forming)/AMP-acid ligase II